ncbi:SAM-dependent methyltransferase [Amycolatopsis sp. GM8]|uniref:SAM-dependent methyltransferase n=1 Tax=Amycolatopsis sp. GM8 TaxID=2896530 RepID=UPI001F29D6C8|nr:SAM-dependent methyltransferase [Amycolatopsis sp. GM8]
MKTPSVEGADDPGTIARIRDCWLDGSHHTSVDREVGEHILTCAPHLPFLVRAQRQLLARMVRYLTSQGMTQFLDLGSGVPADGQVHEIAQAANPDAKVVYVDIDASLAEEGARLLADNPNAEYLRADIRHPADVLGAPETQRLLDLDQPVAVLMIETLLHLPDSARPVRLVADYVAGLTSGSYIGISHFSQNEDLEQGLNIFSRMFGMPPAVTLRSREQQERFFTGLEMVEPGLVPVPMWRPDSEHIDRNPHLAEVFAGLGRKR